MKKSMILALVAILAVLLAACGKDPVVAQEPPVVATPTIESPDEGKPTEVPPEPVVTEEPTPEPEPTLEPTPEPEEEILPEPELDINNYINDEYGFDFMRFAKDFGCEKKHPVSIDTERMTGIAFSINGWVVIVWGVNPDDDEDGYIAVGKKVEGDPYNQQTIPKWDIPFRAMDITDENSILITWKGISYLYSTESIQKLPYIIQWCKDNPYTDEAPGVFKDEWEVW